MTTTSQKYPGWMIEKLTEGSSTSYLMTRDGSYAIQVRQNAAGEWLGSIAMKTSYLGTLIAPFQPFAGTVATCIAEIDRRAESAARLAAHRTAPWGASARKLRGDRSRQPGTYGYARPAFRRAI
jgi:hypothetical protein